MKSLFIDTSTSNITIVLVEDSNILFNYKEKILSDMSSKILPIIDKGLKENNLTLNDIEKIFVVNGPGSFTGIRIGVTIGKIIAYSLNKKIIPISSLELMASTKTNKKYLIPMIDARRNNVFAGIYDINLNSIKDDKLINIDDLLKDINKDYEILSYDNLNIENLIIPNPDIIKIILKHQFDKDINPHNLNPKYLKLTQAEESKL